MHLVTAVTDADLLWRYLREGDEGAFSSLVRTHERMVIATAWRLTGDADLAKDVAQQVFATMARKASLLAERKCLAGWLHIAATHLATRSRAAEAARRSRQEEAASASVARVAEDVGPLLDEALSSLGEAEREALILHYFEDRSYSEMAAALGLQEAAVRKRVSRGLKSLGEQLRKRGFHGSAIAALMGAGAMQTGLLSLTAAGAALTLPVAAGSSSFALTFATLMGNTVFKISAALVIASAIPIVWQSHANSAIRAEIADLRRSDERRVSTPIQPNFDATALRAEAAALTEAFAASRGRGEAMKISLAENQQLLDRMQQEVLVKLGKSEDLARTFAAKLERILPLINDLQRKEDHDAAFRDGLDHVSRVAMELVPSLGQLRRLEEEPEQAGRFMSTLLGEMMKLPPETSAQVERAVVAGYTDLKRDELTLSSRPRKDPEKWDAQRDAADKALTARVLAVVPKNSQGHPLYQLISDSEGILLPHEFGFLSSLPGGGPDELLRANSKEKEAEPSDKKP